MKRVFLILLIALIALTFTAPGFAMTYELGCGCDGDWSTFPDWEWMLDWVFQFSLPSGNLW